VERHSELKGKALLFLLFLWILWFLNVSARTIFSPILPLIEDEFMIRHARASSIFIFQSMGYASSVCFAGFYSGRFGYKRSIALSLAITSFALFLLSFIKTFSAFYLFSFILGLASGIYLPSVLPFITEYFVENKWGKSIAIHDSAASISIFSTPLVILFFIHFCTWRGVLEVLAVALMISAVIFYSISDEIKIRHSQKIRLGNLLKTQFLWVMIIIWVFAAGANIGVYFIVPLYLTKELSLSIGSANSILGMSRLGGIGVAVLCGFLIDRFNLKKLMFAMLFLSGICTILVGVVPAGFIGFSLFFQAIFMAGFFPAALVTVTKMFSSETRSVAIGIILAFSVIFGGGLVPYLLGFAGDLLSFRFGISLLGILVSLSSLLIFSLKELK
jgi:NNP family nitrate/nitrite transporter-like MFS transporter